MRRETEPSPAAHDTSNIRPAEGVGGAQTRMAWRTSSASSPRPAVGVRGGRFGVITCTYLHPSSRVLQPRQSSGFPTGRERARHPQQTSRRVEARGDGTAARAKKSMARGQQTPASPSNAKLILVRSPPLPCLTVQHSRRQLRPKRTALKGFPFRPSVPLEGG